MNNRETRNDAPEKHRAKRSNLAWWVFAAIALFYLLTEHQAHFLGALPYLLLLACPLMHLFMHHGHGHHGHGHHGHGHHGHGHHGHDEGDKK